MRRARLFTFLILSSMAAGAACALQGTTPVKPVSVVGEPSGAFKEAPKGPEYHAPQFASDREGALYLLWLAIEPGKSWDVLLARSEDLGVTWSRPPLSFKPDKTTVAGGIRVATGPRGSVYVAWREWETKTKRRSLRFMRSPDKGERWEGPAQPPNASSDMSMPDLLANQDGHVVVAWLVGPRDRRNLDVVNSRDAGVTFLPQPSRLTAAFPTSEYGITNHRVASDGMGRLYVVWEEIKSALDHQIYLNRSVDQGKTWATQPTLLSAPEGGRHLAYKPQIQAMPDGRVYVAWEQDVEKPDRPYQPGEIRRPDRMIYFNRSLDFGQTWLPHPIRLNGMDQRPIQSLNPRLSAGRDGHVYVTWLEGEGSRQGRILLARSTDSGITWNALMRLDLSSPFKGVPASPEIRSDDAGHVWVVWQELTNKSSEWRLLMNRSSDDGQAWLPQAVVLTRLPQRGWSFRGVAFEADPRGHLYVAWDGGPENDRAIYWTRSTDFGATWPASEVQIGKP